MWSGKKSRKHPCLAPGTRLARWPCGWERVGGWLGLRGRAPRGVGGSEAGPLSTTTTTSFFDRDGSTAVCPPPPPPERGSPVDDVDAAERTRKTGRGARSRSCECQQTSTPHFSVSFRSPAQTGMEHFQNISPSPGWMAEHPRPPRLAVGALERGCSRRGRPSDAGQWAQQLKAAWERGTWRACRVLTGRLSLTASPARRPVASIGPFGSTWSAILARASCTKNKLCRQEARVGEGRRGGERGEGTRADQRSDSLAIQKACRGSLPHCPGRDGKNSESVYPGTKRIRTEQSVDAIQKRRGRALGGISMPCRHRKKKGARMLDWIVEECYPKSRQR